MYTEFDGKGDLDRMSFLGEVRGGRQEVIDLLPPLASMLLKPSGPAAAEVVTPSSKPPSAVKKS